MDKFIFTKDQKVGISTFQKFMQSDKNYMTLSGFAGCGKTTLVNEILANYMGDVVITAPTHKALSVLRDKTDSCHYDDSRTIHSLLNLKIKKKHNKEVLYHDENADTKMPESGLIVIDECSMIGRELLDYLQGQLPKSVKVLFVGDILQLPPVGESVSPTFEETDFKADLVEVVRQAMGNPIIAMTVQIREAIRKKNENVIDFKTKESDDLGIVVYKKVKPFKTALFNVVDNSERIVDSYKVISWRNAIVNTYNDAVRKHVYNGTPSDDFMVGERVVINDSIMENDVIIPRDSEGSIVSISKIVVDKFIMMTREPLHAYELKIYIPQLDHYTNVIALSTVSKAPFEKALKHLAGAKSWSTFWKLKEEFKDIRQIHSITSHKSQGSTYKETFINADDILANPNTEEGLKCLYVAVSRASDKSHILYK